MAKASPPKPWAVVPMAEKGSTQRQIFAAVGHALSTWERMEFSLSELYHALLDAKNEGAVAAYGTVMSSSSRMTMLHQAYEFFRFKGEPQFTGIPELINNVREFSNRRDEIAHGMVSMPTRARGWYLAPSWYHTKNAPRSAEGASEKYNYGIGKYAYSAEQIDAYREQFKALHERAHIFTSSVTLRLVFNRERGD